MVVHGQINGKKAMSFQQSSEPTSGGRSADYNADNVVCDLLELEGMPTG